MKILFIDVSTDGHHLPYLKALCDTHEYDSYVILPNKNDNIKSQQIINSAINFSSRKIKEHLKFLKIVLKVANDVRPDIIHFLYGDDFYRFFGIGLQKFKKYKVIMTFHHIRRSFLHDISLKRIFSNIYLGVVHTRKLLIDMKQLSINNISQIEYPCFGREIIDYRINIDIDCIKENDKPLILAIGETRYDKGLDILLGALKGVNKPFHLLIAGSAIHFDEKFIETQISGYRENVTLIFRHLTNEEYINFISKSDIVVLPYRRVFDGASGPLADGVWFQKQILGPDHGSLGELIRTYSLGSTFEAENIDSLKETLNNMLSKKVTWNSKAEEYRDKLKPETFASNYNKIYKNIFENTGNRNHYQ